MRFLYTCLLYLILPFIFLRLWWKGQKLSSYKERMGERLGFYPWHYPQSIWVHAVSVGEAVAAISLIKAIKHHYPHLPIVVTTMTPTGAERIKAAFQEEVTHAYLPYDIPDAVNRFLNAAHPIAGFIMETEIWPNLLATCAKRSIPVALLNGRLSEKSATQYAKMPSLTKEMLQSFAVIAVQGESDAKRFIALKAPAEKVTITGNIKFDLALDIKVLQESKKLKNQLGERFVWIAASTHAGEEEIILAAHNHLRKTFSNALLIIVPRHPNRFNEVGALCAKSDVTIRRSSQIFPDENTSIYLGDTMGELMLLYGICDVAFVGGSLIPRGGHNLLEPAALGKPLLSGPYYFNFTDVNHLLLAANGLLIVEDVMQLTQKLIQLAQDENQRKILGHAAEEVVKANRGALSKQFSLIQSMLDLASVESIANQ